MIPSSNIYHYDFETIQFAFTVADTFCQPPQCPLIFLGSFGFWPESTILSAAICCASDFSADPNTLFSPWLSSSSWCWAIWAVNLQPSSGCPFDSAALRTSFYSLMIFSIRVCKSCPVTLVPSQNMPCPSEDFWYSSHLGSSNRRFIFWV